MKLRGEYGKSLLIPLFCPNCRKQYGVTPRLLGDGHHTEKDVAYLDGRTPKNLEKLLCPRCLTVFPLRKSKIPSWVFESPYAKPKDEGD